MSKVQERLINGLLTRCVNLIKEGQDIFFKMYPTLEDSNALKPDYQMYSQLEKEYKQNNRELFKVNEALIKITEGVNTPKAPEVPIPQEQFAFANF